MTGQRKVRNLLALAVLAYLSNQPMHPYELARSLRENGDGRSIKFNHGTLYMVVGQLSKAGYITELETSREGQRPERTVYGMTDAGRDELRDWLSELVAEPHHEYPHFVAALSVVGVLPPSRVVSLLGQRLERLRQVHAETDAIIAAALSGGVLELFVLEEQYRLAMQSAEIEFVERLIDRVTDPEGSWGAAWAQYHGEPPPARSQALRRCPERTRSAHPGESWKYSSWWGRGCPTPRSPTSSSCPPGL